MSAVEVGRVCVKISGRETGRKCVIVDVMDRNFILVTGPKEITGVKRRRVNINHIEPTNVKMDIKRGASDEDVIEALKSADKVNLMKEIVKPKIQKTSK